MLPRSGKEGIKDRQRDHKALLSPPPDAANTSPFAATAGHGGGRPCAKNSTRGRLRVPRALSGRWGCAPRGMTLFPATYAKKRPVWQSWHRVPFAVHTRDQGKCSHASAQHPFHGDGDCQTGPFLTAGSVLGVNGKAEAAQTSLGRAGGRRRAPELEAGAAQAGFKAREESAGKPPPRRPGKSPRPFGTWIAGATRSARRLPPAGARCRCPGGTWPRRRRRRRTSRQGRARPATSTGPWRSRGSRS